MEEQQKLVKKSLEIQVEEKQVAEMKNKVQNGEECTSSDKQQHQADNLVEAEHSWLDVSRDERCINCYRRDEYQNRAHAEEKTSSESKQTSRLVRNVKLTGRTRESETPRRTWRISRPRKVREAMLYSEKHPHEGKAQGQVSTKASLPSWPQLVQACLIF